MTYIYIYIYIFTNLLSTSIHGYQKKNKKKNVRNKRPKYLESPPGEKNVIGQKERKGQPRHTSRKKSRDVQSVVKKKN